MTRYGFMRLRSFGVFGVVAPGRNLVQGGGFAYSHHWEQADDGIHVDMPWHWPRPLAGLGYHITPGHDWAGVDRDALPTLQVAPPRLPPGELRMFSTDDPYKYLVTYTPLDPAYQPRSFEPLMVPKAECLSVEPLRQRLARYMRDIQQELVEQFYGTAPAVPYAAGQFTVWTGSTPALWTIPM